MIHPLQTSQWANFRESWGNEVAKTKYGYITLHKLPFTNKKIGMFLKGPEPTRTMLKELRTWGKEHNLVFIKLEPNVAFGNSSMQYVESSKEKQKLTKILKTAGAVAGKTLFTPTTFWINLERSEEELLKSFTSKTRYNIKLAGKKGVTVTEDDSSKAFEKYLKLARETVIRDKFFAHNERYHRLMWETLHESLILNHKSPIAYLLTAKYNEEIVTAWIVFAYDGFLYYPYGASTHKYKNVMASNLMMWEAIKFGRKLGCHTFDLWGREPGKGFTKFKEGYNPQVVEFLGTWDLVIDKKLYYLYRGAERLRWVYLKLQAQLGLTKYRF